VHNQKTEKFKVTVFGCQNMQVCQYCREMSPFQAAYRDNTLGLPKLCPQKNINKIDRELLFTYLSQHYTPERMVVAGVGVDHDKLCDAVQKHFVDKKAIWESDRGLFSPHKNITVDDSVAQYTGGLVQVRIARCRGAQSKLCW
jgi:hypothetical protein